MNLPNDLVEALMTGFKEVAENNKHGYGYLPSMIARDFGYISPKAKELREKFPYFNGVYDPNKEMTVSVSYCDEFVEMNLPDEFKN